MMKPISNPATRIAIRNETVSNLIFFWLSSWRLQVPPLFFLNHFLPRLSIIPSSFSWKYKYRIDAIYTCPWIEYTPLNRTSSRILRVAAASWLAQEFQIVFPAKVKIKNSTTSVYSPLYVHTVWAMDLISLLSIFTSWVKLGC